MSTPLSRVITNEIFRVPARRQRKVEVRPSDIPTVHYTAHLADVRWLRRAARRKIAGAFINALTSLTGTISGLLATCTAATPT